MRTKRAARLAQLEEQRERLEYEAYDLQRTVDVREIGPIITAYGTIITWLDKQIELLKG